MIEFRTVDGDNVLGTVEFDGTNLIADPQVQDIVDAFLERAPAEKFEEEYDGWSNGYVVARSSPSASGG